MQSADTKKTEDNEQKPVNTHSPNFSVKVGDSTAVQMKAVKELPPKRSGVLSVFNVNEPTPKMKEIRNDGKMGIVFNNKITFPDNFLEIIQNNRLRCLEDSEVPPLIEIIPESGDTESTVSQAIDWEITSVGEKNIDFKLVFSEPMEVS